MKIIVGLIISPLILAGCMPTQESASASFASSEVSGVSAPGGISAGGLLASSSATGPETNGFQAPVNVPLPPKRPNLEGEEIASRSLGAVVADADKVDSELERKAAQQEAEDSRAAKSASAPQMSIVAAAATRGSTITAPASAPPPLIQYASLSPNLSPATQTPAARGLTQQAYYASYSDTNVSCFPPELREALNTIAAHYGQQVEVTSGFRTHGRRHSMHRYCKAADIRVPGVGPRELAAYAKTVPNVNGVGTYRYNTVTHVDVRDSRMSWRY